MRTVRLDTTRLVAALAAALLVPTAQAQALEGRIVQLQGDVRFGAAPARAGQPVQGGTLTTGADGRVQLRMRDGTLIALPPASELRLPRGSERQIVLVNGGLRLNPSTAAEGAVWRVDLQDRSIRTNGYLTLQGCAAGCTLPPGLYGRIAQGEA